MANFKESEAKNIATKNTTVRFDGFGGIDNVRHHTSPTRTADAVNFRVCADGSLEKRQGYRRLCSFDSSVRAVWTGVLDHEFRAYALAGSNIYRINADNGEKTLIATVGTSDTAADFFYYRGCLYLIDGDRLKGVTDDGLFDPFGYVPLIGKDWRDSVRGELYEPRNILNNKGRISYIVSENSASVLCLDEYTSSIEAVYVNGEVIPPDRYSVSKISPVLNVSGLSFGDKVCVYFTYADTPYTTDELMKNTRAIVFGGINTSRPFLFGGSDGSVMYSCAYVSSDSLAESRKEYPDSDALYFPNNYEFTVGDGRYPISAVSRHYDRLLIFTEGGAWLADSSACGTEEFPVMNINSSVGVVSQHGAALLGNSPCTAGKDGFYRWTTDTDELNDCNAYRISEAIEPLVDKNFYTSARIFADSRRRELLFSCPEASDRLWVYSEAVSAWTSFDGIGAESFFEFDGNVGFVKNNSLYIFDDSAATDDGEEIVASFTSGICDFETDRAKHLSELGISFENGEVTASVYTDGKTIPTAVATFEADGHTPTRKRLSSGRFSHLSAKLDARGNSRPRIHSLYIKAR